MKRILVVTFFLVAITLGAQNQKTELDEVRLEMQKQVEAWNKGDIYAFMESYWRNDSLKFISTAGITYGWQQTTARYLKGYPSKEAMGVLKFTILDAMQLSENGSFIIGKWELEKEKPAGGHFSLLWKKIDGKWRIIVDHTS